MAGMDYLDCAECGRRLLYDGDFRIRKALDGDTVTCGQCTKRLKKKIDKLKKHDRRKH